MDDLISRKETIDLLSDYKDRLLGALDCMDIVGIERRIIESCLELIEACIKDIESLESTDKYKTTFGDMLKMFRDLMKQDDIIDDYRPNSKMYVEDLENRVGIRIWCKNGDSIVYYPNIEK